MSDKRIFRLALAPTGNFHIGGFWAYVFNRKIADKLNGRLILRIDDTIPSKDNWWENFTRLSKYLDMRFDQVYWQSQRDINYRLYLSRLSGLHTISIQKGSILMKVDQMEIGFKDHIRNNMISRRLLGGEMCLYRKDRGYTYHMASCADDFFMGITDLIRSSDHLDNSCLHSYIDPELFNRRLKMYLIPLIVDNHGQKISKRKNQKSYDLADILNAGYLPEAIYESLEKKVRVPMHSRPFSYCFDDLKKINSRIMKKMENQELMQKVNDFCHFAKLQPDKKAIDCYIENISRGRESTLLELIQNASLLAKASLNALDRMIRIDHPLVYIGTDTKSANDYLYALTGEQKKYIRQQLFQLDKSPSIIELVRFFIQYTLWQRDPL